MRSQCLFVAAPKPGFGLPVITPRIVMLDNPLLQYVTDAKGNIASVIIPWALWEKMEPKVRKLLEAEAGPKEIVQAAGPLASFDELMQFWDFKYPYSPSVTCPHCAAATEDWRNDPAQPFVLTNANIGGLLVFYCRACGTTIRQKHFHKHMAVEHTTPKE
jgi:hypothetical protein